MNYNPNEPSDRMDAERRSTEAELFAEILSRMDGKQQDGQSGAGRQPAAQSVNLIELFYYLLSKLYLILLGMIAGAVLLGCYAAYRVTPVLRPPPSCTSWAPRAAVSLPTCRSVPY